jgi:hypothetical protein
MSIPPHMTEYEQALLDMNHEESDAHLFAQKLSDARAALRASDGDAMRWATIAQDHRNALVWLKGYVSSPVYKRLPTSFIDAVAKIDESLAAPDRHPSAALASTPAPVAVDAPDLAAANERETAAVVDARDWEERANFNRAQELEQASRAEKAEADAAAMRQAYVNSHLTGHWDFEPFERPDAGRALLAEVARLREENAAHFNIITEARDLLHCRDDESLPMALKRMHEENAATKVTLWQTHGALVRVANLVSTMSGRVPYEVAEVVAPVLADSDGNDESKRSHQMTRSKSPLVAALGRAHAALRQLVEAPMGESDANWLARVKVMEKHVRRLFIDPEGKAAGELFAALEAEHEAVAELDQHEALACLVDPPCGGCDACTARIAHAAVEALRGGK